MAKKDFSAAIDASLQAEEQAVEDRFSRANAYYKEKDSRAATTRSVVTQPKAIRDLFSMPPDDHAIIAQIQAKCLKVGIVASKSQVIRAGLHALCDLSDVEVGALVARLEQLKPGKRS
jgi:hypothetical protein